MSEIIENNIRVDLRHVRTGRECLKRQYGVIERLRLRRLPTGEAERILGWLEEMQRVFENDYKRLLSEGQGRLRAANYVDPTANSYSNIRAALRHARWARECVRRQYEIIEDLRLRRLPTDEAERGLSWFLQMQHAFEDDYKRLLREGQERLRRAGQATRTLNPFRNRSPNQACA
jgi:hypothetical protein